MAQLRPGVEFSSDDLAYFTITELVTVVATDVLRTIFIWGCKKPRDQTLENYLKNEKGWKDEKYENYFKDELARKHIVNSPHGELFDITLLFASIKVACDLAPANSSLWYEVPKGKQQPLEYLLFSAKDFRNEIIHFPERHGYLEVSKELASFQTLLENILTMGSKLFDKVACVNDCLTNLQDKFTNIKSTVLVQKNQLEHSKTQLLTKGRRELNQTLNRWSHIVPVHFLGKHEMKIKVSLVFTDLQVMKQSDGHASPYLVYTDMFQLTDENIKHPAKIILIEGSAGSGKTTLMKFVMNDWYSESKIINGLEKYELLLFTECRTKSISTFSQLLDLSMPRTTSNMEVKDLVNAAVRLKTLIIIDGLDELNPNSEKLLKEIFELTEKYDITLICTLRTEKLKFTMKLVPPTLETSIVRILGIHQSKRLEFVEKYYDQLPKYMDEITEDIKVLLNFLTIHQDKMGEHLRFPINLVLLTYLWLKNPKKIPLVTNATSLYNEIFLSSLEKLKERLVKGGFLHDLNRKLNTVFDYIYDEALRSLSLDDIILSDDTILRIKEICSSNQINLPYEEIFSTFLVQRPPWADLGSSEQYSFPHKGLQDFFAAKSVLNKIIDVHRANSKMNDSFSIIELLQNLPLSSDREFDVTKFRNVLMHLTGLVCQVSSPLLLSRFGKELVDLNKMAGVDDTWHWFDLIAETKNDCNMARLIAPQIDTDKWIVEDGHIAAAHTLLQFTLPNRVSLELSRKPQDLSNLPEIIQHIGTLACSLELRFYRHFQDMDSGYGYTDYTDDYFLPIINKSCELRVVKGALSIGSVAKLPDTVWQLHLCIYSNESARDLANIKLTQLRDNGVGLHLLRNVDPSSISSFPYPVFTLYLSRLNDSADDAEWASNAVVALQKDQKWQFIQLRIADATLTLEGTKRILQKMAATGVRIMNRRSGGIIKLSSKHLSDKDIKPLKAEAKRLWNCIVSIKKVTTLMDALGEDF